MTIQHIVQNPDLETQGLRFLLSDIRDLERLVNDAIYEVDAMDFDAPDADQLYRMKLHSIQGVAEHIARSAEKRRNRIVLDG